MTLFQLFMLDGQLVQKLVHRPRQAISHGIVQQARTCTKAIPGISIRPIRTPNSKFILFCTIFLLV